MKKILEIGNEYAKKSDWKDFAFTKLCLCAMGILIGMYIPTNMKMYITIIAAIIFGITYILLMSKVFKIIKEMKVKKD